jgi:energy-coupling factor transport system substrate-specific component
MIMNLWFWPYVTGGADQYWTPGLGLAATLQRYALFYVTTSLSWDVMRAAGNGLLLLAFGGAILRLLRRFHARFAYRYTSLAPLPASAEKTLVDNALHPAARMVAPLEQR